MTRRCCYCRCRGGSCNASGLRTDTIWPYVYSAAVIAFNSYLVYQSVRRYLVYRHVLPHEAAYHLITLVIAVLLLPLAVVFSFLRLHTYTNCDAQVGEDLLRYELSSASRPVLRRLHMGLPPLAQLFHVISAYLLLIPHTYAVTYGKRRHIMKDSSTDLAGYLTSGPVLVAASALPNSTAAGSGYVSLPSSDLEAVNLLLSLLVYAGRTVSVFWSSSRVFSLLFGSQLLLSIAIHFLSHLGYSVLYLKIETDWPADAPPLLSPWSLTLLYVLGNAFLFTSPWCVFHFWYGVVLDHMESYLKTLGQYQKLGSSGTPYLAHGLALFSILLYVACNGPIMYDYVSAYGSTRGSADGGRVLMAHLVACVLYMLFWIVLWLGFTIKQHWRVRLKENLLKRYVILQSQRKFFLSVNDDDEGSSALPESPNHFNLVTAAKPTEQTPDISDDNFSSSTVSSAQAMSAHGKQNGILSNRQQPRPKRKSQDQKVKFQAATKIFIETNIDSDLDTIPESSSEADASEGNSKQRNLAQGQRSSGYESPGGSSYSAAEHQRIRTLASDLERGRGSLHSSNGNGPVQELSSPRIPYSPRNIRPHVVCVPSPRNSVSPLSTSRHSSLSSALPPLSNGSHSALSFNDSAASYYRVLNDDMQSSAV